MSGILNVANMAAIAAGKVIMQSFDRLDRVKVHKKANGDYVSSVDTAAENAIISCILKYYPNHKIISEESGVVDSPATENITWVIDPLDGTNNFIHGVPHFCVAIAVKDSEKVICSVIYDPFRDEFFSAQIDKGATLNNKRIKLTNPQQSFATSLIATGFPRLKSESLKLQLQAIENIVNISAGIRRMGATSLDVAYVAAGRFGGYWDVNLQEWDIAAGLLIASEAGALSKKFLTQNDMFDNGIAIAPVESIDNFVKALQQAF